MPSDRYQIVVVAASAGGIEAISIVLAALPPTFPIPIAVVQHRGRGPVSALADILGNGTSLRVKDAESGEELKAGCVYLAPGDTHLAINDNRTAVLSIGPRVRFVRPSADAPFRSAAEVYGRAVIAIVLTGASNDAHVVRLSSGRPVELSLPRTGHRRRRSRCLCRLLAQGRWTWFCRSARSVPDSLGWRRGKQSFRVDTVVEH